MSNQQHPTTNRSDKTANKAKEFDYDSAFEVNYGIFSKDEQEKIRKARRFAPLNNVKLRQEE